MRNWAYDIQMDQLFKHKLNWQIPPKTHISLEKKLLKPRMTVLQI